MSLEAFYLNMTARGVTFFMDAEHLRVRGGDLLDDTERAVIRDNKADLAAIVRLHERLTGVTFDEAARVWMLGGWIAPTKATSAIFGVCCVERESATV